MHQVTLELPDELADELKPYQFHLLHLLRLGLREWHKTQTAQPQATVEDVLKQLEDEGKLIRPTSASKRKTSSRRSLVRVTGKPIREIVIEQR